MPTSDDRVTDEPDDDTVSILRARSLGPRPVLPDRERVQPFTL